MRVIVAIIIAIFSGCQSHQNKELENVCVGNENNQSIKIKDVRVSEKKGYTVSGVFSDLDERFIVKLVNGKSSNNPVIGLFRLDQVSAEVLTGYDGGPLDGKGIIYELGKVESGWVILNEYNWEK
jgi:hypothetical protein